MLYLKEFSPFKIILSDSISGEDTTLESNNPDVYFDRDLIEDILNWQFEEVK